MITPDQAEELAQHTVELYLNQCLPRDAEECGKALIKLFSMCGLALVGVVGREQALHIAEATMENMSRQDLNAQVQLIRRN